VRPKQKRLLGSSALQCDEDVGNVLLSQMMRLIADLQSTGARKSFQQ